MIGQVRTRPVSTVTSPRDLSPKPILFGRKLKVLITAGGTKEYIDPVRYITNFSSGAFGRAFGVEAVKRGHQVLLLGPKELPKLTGPLPEGIDFRPFRSTADLQTQLQKAASEQQWDVVIHSAAVSDYTPAEVPDKKISSDKDELWIRLVRTPKLIKSFREWFGRAFLVGFKLLKGVDPKERHRIALEQIKKNRTNLCVENDLTEVTSEYHKARLVTPEGGAIPVPAGSKQMVAAHILDFIEKREDVHWFQTIQDATLPKQPKSEIPRRLLKLAQDSGLLTDANGNASVRLKNGTIAITPRGVDKSQLTEADWMVARVMQRSRKVRVHSERKPSIDTSVSDALYRAYPNLKATIHTHSPWSLTKAKSGFPFPCGVKEEAKEIINTLNHSGYQDGKPFLVHLTHHGDILGLSGNLSLEMLEQQWQTAKQDFKDHMQEIGVSEVDLAEGKLTGILSTEGFVGHIFTSKDGTIAARLLPQYQGKGYGKLLLDRIIDQGVTIKTVDECEVLDFYQKRGFEVVKKEGRFYYLKPPVSSKPWSPFHFKPRGGESPVS